MLRPDGWGGRRNELAEHWDWGPLYGAFEVNGKNTISPSDLDCIIERNGYFLVLETKNPGEKMSTGQARALFELARMEPRFFVFVVHGKRNEPTHWRRVLPSLSEPTKEVRYGPTRIGGWPALYDLANRWFRWANTQRRTK